MSKYKSTVLAVRPLAHIYTGIPLEKGQCRTELRKIVMVESDKVVAIHENELINGVSKNGIPWSRWKNVKSDFFSIKSGIIQSYAKQGKSFHNSTKLKTFGYSRSPEVCEAINRLLLANGADPIEDFSPRAIFKAAYPLFSHWDAGYRTLGIPNMGAKTIQEFTLKAFGKTRYRKDLVKAVASAKTPDAFRNAHRMRGLVPVDWIVAYLKTYETVGPRNFHDLRRALELMSMQQRKTILTVMTKDARGAGNGYMLEDMLDFVVQLPEDVVQSIKIKPSEIDQAHMQFAAALNKIRYADQIIEENATAKFISKIDWSDAPVTMKVGTSTHEVMQWGVDMGHCIGGYANEAAQGRCTLAGIYKGGTLIGNAMFRKKQCVQIFGKFNKELPDDVLKSIIEKMENYRFDNTWGIPLHLRVSAPTKLEDDVAPAANPWLEPVPF